MWIGGPLDFVMPFGGISCSPKVKGGHNPLSMNSGIPLMGKTRNSPPSHSPSGLDLTFPSAFS